MKRILILIDTTIGGTTGGAETHIRSLLSGIDPANYSVDVIYFDTDELDADEIDHAYRNDRGINYYRIPVRRIHSFSSIKHLKEIYRIMKTGNYDCLMSFFETSDIIVAFLGSLSGIKMRISNRRDTGFRNSKKLRLVYPFVNKFFTHFIAVSEAVKESIVLQGVKAEKIHVVYNSVDTERFKSANGAKIKKDLGLSSDDMVLGMVANLYPVKNHISVFEALADLHKEGKFIHLVLAGAGGIRKELDLKIENMNLTQYVHFLGARFDVENILDCIDIFVLASHTEGLSNALLEAMASKKPVIATRVGGNVEVVENGVDGILVSTDSSSIADAIRKLVDSTELRKEMGEKGFERIKRQFSLERMLDSYMEIINLSGNNSGLSEQTTRLDS